MDGSQEEEEEKDRKSCKIPCRLTTCAHTSPWAHTHTHRHTSGTRLRASGSFQLSPAKLHCIQPLSARRKRREYRRMHKAHQLVAPRRRDWCDGRAVSLCADRAGHRASVSFQTRNETRFTFTPDHIPRPVPVLQRFSQLLPNPRLILSSPLCSSSSLRLPCLPPAALLIHEP